MSKQTTKHVPFSSKLTTDNMKKLRLQAAKSGKKLYEVLNKIIKES